MSSTPDDDRGPHNEPAGSKPISKFRESKKEETAAANDPNTPEDDTVSRWINDTGALEYAIGRVKALDLDCPEMGYVGITAGDLISKMFEKIHNNKKKTGKKYENRAEFEGAIITTIRRLAIDANRRRNTARKNFDSHTGIKTDSEADPKTGSKKESADRSDLACRQSANKDSHTSTGCGATSGTVLDQIVKSEQRSHLVACLEGPEFASEPLLKEAMYLRLLNYDCPAIKTKLNAKGYEVSQRTVQLMFAHGEPSEQIYKLLDLYFSRIGVDRNG